ncbi:MAG: peptide chain release factor N(5)-glutamine methyltransferase [bacterium]|nr:peptide chain release factor N(5)-glutamine methyltransferase [bacterium]
MLKEQEIRWLVKEKYNDVINEAAQIDIARIKQGEPVAYVIGFVDFLGCKIDMSQRPLIPRLETEFWVEQVIRNINKDTSTIIKCLDMFTGSGCIGVAVLKNVPSTTVDFVDCDEEAITQVTINCKLNDIAVSRRQIIKSNMFEYIDDSYDYIFANPPYIAENKISEMQKSVLDYEPHRALFGGSGGLFFIKAFLDKASKYLNDTGKIYMEFDTHQKDAIEKILIKNGFKEINFFKDQFKKWRYLLLRKQ